MDADDFALDAALVDAAEDLEGAVIAPVRVPRVVHQPVVSAVLGAPANDFDGVAAELLATHVLVDAALVGREVGVDGEGSLDWAVVHDFALDGADLAVHGIATVAKGLVGNVCFSCVF